jgi:hypothetical protein
MGKAKRLKNNKKRGTTYVATMLLFAGLSAAGIVYLDSSSNTMRNSRRRQMDVQMTQLCEAAIQACLRNEWRDFKTNQNFTSLDSDNNGATLANPRSVASGSIPDVGRYSAGIVSYGQPSYADSWVRGATIRAVGWIDRDNDGAVDNNEAVKVVEVKVEFRLKRSEVFDYTYFVNNFGWMSGFNQDNLIMNGDVRANGDFTFSNGVPTVNGSVIAAANEKIDGSPRGVVNLAPVKDTNAQYIADQAGGNDLDNQARWRQAYDPAKHGARGSATYNAWKDIIFDSEASVQGGNVEGAKIFDNSGAKSWSRTNSGQAATTTQLDNVASQEVIMPDLSALSTYQTASQNYIDGKATYSDGTANPFFNQGAWVEVWNSSTNRYDRLGTNGVITGSAVLIGTSTRPIRIHGPVTVTQDIVIKGNISGQGTLYSGRNVHIVGSIRYTNKPDFRGSNPTTIDSQNEKADALGLAARGSVLYGNPNNYNSTNFYYMTPPFTKGRWDDNGNWIPAFNAYEVDSSGRMRYQSVIPDSTMNSIAEGINQVDGVIYTNFVGGGNVGTGGGGVRLNGSMISRDDALVVYSLPLFENYDPRIKERTSTQRPLIDIVLPRSPSLTQSTWQDRGVSYGS